MNAFDLTGKRALITGSSRGIGFAIAEAIAEAGADVVLVSRNIDDLKDAKKKLAKSGRKVDVYSFDMNKTERIEDFYNEVVAKSGPIDILVNNAGATRRGPAETISTEDWDFVMNIDLKAVFKLSQAFAKERIASSASGKIINISSLFGETIRKNNVPYATAKGGIRQMTKACAVDWAQYNINVNAIGPGYIKTKLTEPLQNDPKFDSWVKKRTPMARWGLPKDIGMTALFLAAPASDFITGQSIYVDGGILSVL